MSVVSTPGDCVNIWGLRITKGGCSEFISADYCLAAITDRLNSNPQSRDFVSQYTVQCQSINTSKHIHKHEQTLCVRHSLCPMGHVERERLREQAVLQGGSPLAPAAGANSVLLSSSCGRAGNFTPYTSLGAGHKPACTDQPRARVRRC